MQPSGSASYWPSSARSSAVAETGVDLPQGNGQGKESKVKHLTALLLNDFEVHAVGCADIAKTVRKGKVQNRFNFKAESEHDAVAFLYDDQIAENVAGGDYPDEEAAIKAYSGWVKFLPCCQLQWGTPDGVKPNDVGRADHRKAQAKQVANMAKAKNAAKSNGKSKLTRDQKRELATALVRAAAEVLGDSVVMNGMNPDEAARNISHWLHHLPADRTAWPQVLPKPDRSDWR